MSDAVSYPAFLVGDVLEVEHRLRAKAIEVNNLERTVLVRRSQETPDRWISWDEARLIRRPKPRFLSVGNQVWWWETRAKRRTGVIEQLFDRGEWAIIRRDDDDILVVEVEAIRLKSMSVEPKETPS